MKARVQALSELVEIAKSKGPQRVAVVAAHDPATLIAVTRAREEGLAHFILVGDSEAMGEIAEEEGIDLTDVSIVDEPLPKPAARKAVELVNQGQAELLMNGLAQPRYLIEAALALGAGELLAEIGVFEIPDFDHLILVGDIGVTASPTLEQKAAIVQSAIEVAHRLGIERPRVALLSPTEVVDPKIPISLEAAALSKMAHRGQIKGGFVDGPLALDIAISPWSAQVKGIGGEVAGQADVLIVPDLDTGSLLAQTITCLAKGKMAGIVVGGRFPIAMPFPSDPPEARLASLALGVLELLHN